MARARSRWDTRIEQDFSLGMIRDTARTGIPPGGVYDLRDGFVHRPGVAFKRGGVSYAGPKMLGFSATTGRAVYQAPFPTGPELVALGNDSHAYVITPSATTGMNNSGEDIDPVDKPTFFSGGAESILVFTDRSGTEVPSYYSAVAQSTQLFQGGARVITTGVPEASTYTLELSGPPTSGFFALTITAVADTTTGLSSPLAFTTLAIDWDATAAEVKTAIDAALVSTGETVSTSGGPLPGAVTIVFPAGYNPTVGQNSLATEGYPLLTNTTSDTDTIDATSVPPARFSESHLQRLVLANTAAYPSRIWFSPVLNVTRSGWDLANSWIDVDAPVTGLASLQHELLVFTESSYYRLIGNVPPPDTDMILEPVSELGTTDARSITIWEGKCVYANPQGVFLTAGVAPVSLMEDRIESYWQALFTDYVGPLDSGSTWTITTGVHQRRFLFVTVLIDPSGLIVTLVCDLLKRAWTRHSTLDALMYTNSHDDLFFVNGQNNRVISCKGMFSPDDDNSQDVGMGAAEISTDVELLLETRPLAAGLGLKAFGDGELLYDMREVEVPVLDKVMKADGSSGTDAWAEVDLGSNQAEIWKTYEVAFTADALALWLSDGQSSKFSQVWNAAHDNVTDYLWFVGGEWGNFEGQDTPPPPAGATWQLCEERHVASGAVELYVDTVLVVSTTTGQTDQSRFVQAGNVDAITNPDDISYIKNFKVGTTRGDDDLFSWPGTSTDLSAWTSTSGAVTVVDDPF